MEFAGIVRALAGGALAAPFDCDRDGGRCQSSVEDGQRVERRGDGVKGQMMNRFWCRTGMGSRYGMFSTNWMLLAAYTSYFRVEDGLTEGPGFRRLRYCRECGRP